MRPSQPFSLLLLLTTFTLTYSLPGYAGGSDGGDSPNPAPPAETPGSSSSAPLSSSSPLTAGASSLTAAPPTIQQSADFIQNNSSTPSTLNYPNCQGSCLFAIGRMNNSNQWEAILGGIWQLNSPLNRQSKANQQLAESQAKANELLVQAQVNKTTLESEATLIEKIAAAIRAKDVPLARGLATIFAKQTGNKTYETLLQDMMR
jgi:hypothetical protein